METAMSLTRTFTRQELEALGLPTYLPKDRILLDEFFEEHRWSVTNRLVFRSPDDDQVYEIFYETPATEEQEGIDPWDDDPTVDATLVEQRVVFRQDWRPVGSPKRDDEVNMGIDEEAIRRGLTCAVCQNKIQYLDALTGGRWAHNEHPEDGHNAASLIWGTDPAPWAEEEA
jgi:hypothetical protein